MQPCPKCGAAVETPLACAACGALLSPSPPPTPFEVFALEPAWPVEREALRKRLLALTRAMHPDYFGTDPVQRELRQTLQASRG